MSKSDGRFTVEQFFDFLRKIFASVFRLRKLCISSMKIVYSTNLKYNHYNLGIDQYNDNKDEFTYK